MGEESAAAVLKHMSAREVRRLHEAMGELARVRPSEAAKAVLTFLRWLRENHSLKLAGAGDFIRRATSLAVGEENVKEMLGGEEAGPGSAFTLLEGVEPRVLAGLLQKEHPQTAALVLSHMSPAKGAQIIQLFPEKVRVDVVMRIAQLDAISPETVREIASVIELELAEFTMMERGGKVSGASALANLMSNLTSLDKTIGQQTLSGIEASNPKLAADIRQLMFTFEQLEEVDDKYIQALLREVDGELLVKALKTAAPTLRDKILGNMSSRAAEVIRDDLETARPMRLSEVTAAQAEIVRIALTMESEGRFEMPSASENDRTV